MCLSLQAVSGRCCRKCRSLVTPACGWPCCCGKLACLIAFDTMDACRRGLVIMLPLVETKALKLWEQGSWFCILTLSLAPPLLALLASMMHCSKGVIMQCMLWVCMWWSNGVKHVPQRWGAWMYVTWLAVTCACALLCQFTANTLQQEFVIP